MSSFFDQGPQQGAGPVISQQFNPVRAQLAQAMGGSQKSLIDPMMALQLAKMSRDNQAPQAPTAPPDPTDPTANSAIPLQQPPSGIGALPGLYGVIGRQLQGVGAPSSPTSSPKASAQQPSPIISQS